jgi:hypothetical protein
VLYPRQAKMDLLVIVLIIVVVLALLGFFSHSYW